MNGEITDVSSRRNRRKLPGPNLETSREHERRRELLVYRKHVYCGFGPHVCAYRFQLIDDLRNLRCSIPGFVD